jgi:hypothetical protein
VVREIRTGEETYRLDTQPASPPASKRWQHRARSRSPNKYANWLRAICAQAARARSHHRGQRATGNLRSDGAWPFAHSPPTLWRARFHQVRRAAARDGRDAACGGAGQGGAWADRRRDVLTLHRPLEDTLPYLFGLPGIVEGGDPLVQMDAQLKKRRTLDAIGYSMADQCG